MYNKQFDSRNKSVLKKIDKTSIFCPQSQNQDNYFNNSAFKLFLRQSPNKISFSQLSTKNKFYLPNLKQSEEQTKTALSNLRNKNSIGLKILIKNNKKSPDQQNEQHHNKSFQASNLQSVRKENAKKIHSISTQKSNCFKFLSTNHKFTTEVSQLCKTLKISSKNVNREESDKTATPHFNRKLKQKDNLLRRYKATKHLEQTDKNNAIKKNRSEIGMSPWLTKYQYSFMGDGYDI